MFDIYSHIDTWYVMKKGLDHEGCGRPLQFPCNTLLYLLQQISPDQELHVVTDKSLQINQQAAVSTFIFTISNLATLSPVRNYCIPYSRTLSLSKCIGISIDMSLEVDQPAAVSTGYIVFVVQRNEIVQ